MKIVMVCEFFDDRLDYQENMLARAYSRAGHDVTVIASTILSLADYVSDRDRGRGPGSDERLAWGRLVRIPFRYNVLHRIKQYEPLLPIFDEVKPDLLFFHDIIPNLLEGVRYVRANPTCALILDYHADASNSGANWLSRRVLHGVFRKWVLDRARPHLQKILPVTPGSATFLNEIYGVPGSEMELLPLGTDQSYAADVLAGGARGEVRARLGIEDDALVVFTGGKLAPYKRTEDVLVAAAKLKDLPVHVILIGTPDTAHQAYATALADLAADDTRVHLVGWQDRAGVYAHMAASDVAVFPASQSVLWQQSLGMGLPLIVSERSEALRAIQHVGYLNRHDNLIVLDHTRPLPGQIVDHLKDLIGNRERLAAMSVGAIKTAAELLDYDAIAARTLRFCAHAEPA
jgi:1,2-diacylglycerol 3-alpha-glucosyltransferase